jgi:hypothetical protein
LTLRFPPSWSAATHGDVLGAEVSLASPVVGQDCVGSKQTFSIFGSSAESVG